MLDRPFTSQYAIKNKRVKRPGLYGFNESLMRDEFLNFMDPILDGAQCMTLEDYKREQAYRKQLEQQALGKCDAEYLPR